MKYILFRIIHDYIARLDGPLHFRFVLQPLMAASFAIRNGLKDARNNKPLYSWSLLTEPALRAALLRDGWKSISKVFILAVLLDVIYQIIVFRWIHPFETFLVAVTLALVPYVLIRGPVNRILRWWHKPPLASQPEVTKMNPASTSVNDRTKT